MVLYGVAGRKLSDQVSGHCQSHYDGGQLVVCEAIVYLQHLVWLYAMQKVAEIASVIFVVSATLFLCLSRPEKSVTFISYLLDDDQSKGFRKPNRGIAIARLEHVHFLTFRHSNELHCWV